MEEECVFVEAIPDTIINFVAYYSISAFFKVNQILEILIRLYITLTPY